MRNIITIIAGLCLVAGLTFAAQSWLTTSRGDFIVLNQGEVVRDFQFETIQGDEYSLSDFKGQNILVHFWATWCAPCLVEFPDVVEMANANKDVTVIAVSTDRNRAAMDRFLTKFDMPENIKVVYDADQSITQGLFAVYRLPETVLIHSDLTFDRKIAGAYGGWKTMDWR